MLSSFSVSAALLGFALVAAGHESTVNLTISNGHNAVPHASPWIVSIQDQHSVHRCAGSIIDESWVLTAATCTYDDYPFVVAGLYDLDRNETVTRQQRKIHYARVFRHQSGRPPPSSSPSPDDIALIHIHPAFTFTADVGPIALPPANAFPRGKARMLGWGRNSALEGPEYSNILQVVGLNILRYEKCQELASVLPTMLCTGPLNRGISACSGDSGDPLIQHSQLVGIASFWHSPCGENGFPTVFTRTSAYIGWIAKIKRRIKNLDGF